MGAKLFQILPKNNFGIIIIAKTGKRWIDRWLKTNNSADRPRDNRAKLLISNKGMLALNKGNIKLVAGNVFDLQNEYYDNRT